MKVITYGTNVGEEERKKFNHRLTLEEIIKILKNGSDGEKLLLAKRENLNENSVFEYKK